MRRLSLPTLTLLLLLPVSAARAGDAKSRESGHAELIADRYAHDFGVVKQNETRSTSFTYTNTSDHTVKGIRVRGECGCNRVKVSHSELAPGASGKLEVVFNTLTLGGHMRKRVHLFSADHSKGEITIPLKIAIVEGLIVRPPGVTFGDVALGSHPKKAFHVKWYEGEGTPFEITEVRVPGYQFGHTIKPFKDPKDARWKGWTIELQFDESPDLGMFSAEALVRTTDKDRPRLTLPLSANVCGKVWMQSRTLSFGTISQGLSRGASLKFRPFDKGVKFEDVTAKARLGLIQVEVKPDPYHGDKGYWRLSGTVPKDAAVGSLSEEVIELHTGAVGEETTLVKVSGFVRKPRKRPSGNAPKKKDPSPDGR